MLERSLATPVIVFFGAGRLPGAAKQFAPVLERLAAEGGGTWVLGQVDVQRQPAARPDVPGPGHPDGLRGRRRPAVDAFTGVLPEAQLRQWIQAVLKAGGVAVAEPEDPRLDEADDALMTGDLDAAEAAYRKILAESPADAAAEAGLAQVGLARRVAGADPAGRAGRRRRPTPTTSTRSCWPPTSRCSAARPSRRTPGWSALVRRTAGEDRDAVRQHLVSLFTIAGPDDPAVASARRALASALF